MVSRMIERRRRMERNAIIPRPRVYRDRSNPFKLSSCFEYRRLMIVSKYFVGGGLWRLLNINLFITAARLLKSIFSLF
jgi:hypothetical protein